MDASTLTRLSPEIRNLVYEFLFTTDYAVTLKTGRIQHPLTLTCRQVRRETLGMYLSLTPFNAHLDDRPAIPLARWLRTIGPELCLLLREVNIWDLHMLNGSLHGVEMTQQMLKDGTKDGEPFVLQPVGRQVFHKSWYLKDIILPLLSIGIGLERFCILQDGDVLKQTSHFAIVPSSEPKGVQSFTMLAEEFGLSERERASLMRQLEQGRREIRLLDGRRNIILNFDSGRKLISMRQEFIPRDEEFICELGRRYGRISYVDDS